MADHKPTVEQQRICYNYFESLVADVRGDHFTPLDEGAKVEYGNKQILNALFTLHGKKCQVPLCEGTSSDYILEHINGKKWDYTPTNLRIGCRSCNQKEIQYQKTPQPFGNTGKLEKENNSTTKSVNAQEIIEKRLFQEAPTTFRKSKDYKHEVRIFLMQWTAHGQRVSWQKAKADIIARVSCSRTKAEEYLLDYTESNLQPFETVMEGQETYIKRRAPETWNPDLVSAEDRKSYQEAEILIARETTHKLEEQKAHAMDMLLAKQALEIELKIYRQVGRAVDISLFKVQPIDYLTNPTAYQSNGVDGPVCLCCGKRKPMEKEQLVCVPCKASLNEPIKAEQ